MSDVIPVLSNVTLVGVDLGDSWVPGGAVDVLVCGSSDVGIFVGDGCPIDPMNYGCVGWSGEDDCMGPNGGASGGACQPASCTGDSWGARVRYIVSQPQFFVIVVGSNSIGNATDVASFNLSWSFSLVTPTPTGSPSSSASPSGSASGTGSGSGSPSSTLSQVRLPDAEEAINRFAIGVDVKSETLTIFTQSHNTCAAGCGTIIDSLACKDT